jgi:peptidyl-tRNA hydrolase, PTH1 family
MSADLWLIVGLGNPGENYRSTRHNVGFRAAEILALKHDVKFREKDEAIFGSYSLEGREVFLFFPQTYMNESGRAVAPFMRYRQIPLERLLVVSDDLDLPVGRLRLRTSGGTGGHHGLDSIASHLGSLEFARLRIGIDKPLSPGEGAEHVLSTFKPEEKLLIEEAIQKAATGMETYILKGAEVAMRDINKEA